MSPRSFITETAWGVDARRASPAWAAVRVPDAPRLARPVVLGDMVLDLRDLIFRLAGIASGAAAGVLLIRVLGLGGTEGLLCLVLAMLVGGLLGMTAARGVVEALTHRWRQRHDHEPDDVPLAIVSPYGDSTRLGFLVDQLDRAAAQVGTDGRGGVTPEEFRRARSLVIRSIHAEQRGQHSDVAYVAATGWLYALIWEGGPK